MKANESNYLNAMIQAKTMVNMGLITEQEYMKIETKMAKKYSLNSLSIYRLNDLILSPFRVINMIPNSKEVIEDGKHSDNWKTNQSS